jgi:PadR family transcriptional regulator PadR
MALIATMHHMTVVVPDSPDAERASQLLRGVLDMCVLGLLRAEPTYGYELTQRLAGFGLDAVSEGTVYPLLARLQRLGLVEAYAVASESGPPRKYYRLSAAGAALLPVWHEQWRGFATAVEALLSPKREKVQR